MTESNTYQIKIIKSDIDKFVSHIPKCPKKISGKGVVICGGNSDFKSGYIIVKLLQKYNTNINIEWYYVGDELDTKYIDMLKKLNIDIVNCLNVIPKWWSTKLDVTDIKGFMIKPFALMVSKFKEILLLDSDNIPIKDISFLFTCEQYTNSGNLFWSDYNYSKNTAMYKILLPLGEDIYTRLNIESPFKKNINLTESGQILINKEKLWKVICLSYYLNYKKDIFYKMFYGDKDLYYVAFTILNKKYEQCKYFPDGLGDENYITTMINKNPINNNPLFIHLLLNKINNNCTYTRPKKYFFISDKTINTFSEQGFIVFNDSKNIVDSKEESLIQLNSYLSEIDDMSYPKLTFGKKRIFICTPCYNYTCDIRYLQCLIDTKEYLESMGIEVELSFIGYESLITRGRNTFVAKFMGNSKNSHLLFIDGDIMWKKEDVLKLILNDKDIVGGLYPQKKYHWDRLNEIKNNQSYKLLNYNVNYHKDSTRVVNSLLRVKHIATGFMMIKREVFTKLINQYPDKKYCDDINCCKNEIEEKYLYAFFDCNIEDGHYMSEDYYFCNLWSKTGGEIYANFSIDLNHIGSEIYSGKASSLVS